MNNNHKTLSRIAAGRLRRAREQAGKTQFEMSRVLKIGTQAYGDLERYEKEPESGTPLSLDRAVILARHLRIPLAWLIGLTDDEPSTDDKLMRTIALLTDEQRRDILAIAEIYVNKG